MMENSLYSILKNTGVIAPTEVPDALVIRLAHESGFPGSHEEMKTGISVLSRVANASTEGEFAAALSRGEFNAVKISTSEMASVRNGVMSASSSQDGCIVQEGTCVPSA